MKHLNHKATKLVVYEVIGGTENRGKQLTACRDYSEEAIPERDPAYRLPNDSQNQEPTMDIVSTETRLELARCLQQMGMSRAKASALASL